MRVSAFSGKDRISGYPGRLELTNENTGSIFGVTLPVIKILKVKIYNIKNEN